MTTPQTAEQMTAALTASLKLTKRDAAMLARLSPFVPECNGTRRGAAARSGWFRTAYALERRGFGKVVRAGGDRYRFQKAGEP